MQEGAEAGFEPDQSQEDEDNDGANEREAHDGADVEEPREIAQCAGSQQAAHHGEGENAVVKSGVVLGETVADFFDEQRVDGGEGAA